MGAPVKTLRSPCWGIGLEYQRAVQSDSQAVADMGSLMMPSASCDTGPCGGLWQRISNTLVQQADADLCAVHPCNRAP